MHNWHYSLERKRGGGSSIGAGACIRSNMISFMHMVTNRVCSQWLVAFGCPQSLVNNSYNYKTVIACEKYIYLQRKNIFLLMTLEIFIGTYLLWILNKHVKIHSILLQGSVMILFCQLAHQHYFDLFPWSFHIPKFHLLPFLFILWLFFKGTR